MKISKGENKLRKLGLNTPMPINSLLLFTSAENDILNIIRHYACFGQRYISDSLFRLCCGRGKKAIKKAKDALEALGIIQIGEICNLGTEYIVDYSVLCPIIKKLNDEHNAYKRLIIVDEFRGEERALYTQLIKEYIDSNFNNTL